MPVQTADQVLALLSDDEYFLVTIEFGQDERVRTDAPILRPTDAALRLDGPPLVEYAGYACLSFMWTETLDPFYTGHPGSVFPVSAVSRSADGQVVVTGPVGSASLRAADPELAARIGGWADASRDALMPFATPSAMLPLNRKERYYTGTVLPAIVGHGNLHDLTRLLALCDLDDVDLDDLSEVQFFTEYSFAESVYSAADRERFKRRPRNADTPDLVVRGPGWLLAIEAKMFHRPSTAALDSQYQRQSMLVAYWAARFGAHPDLVQHVLLLPQALATETGPGLHVPVITWEAILDAYRDSPETYWIATLRKALAEHPQLASKTSTWGKNAQQRLTGSEICEAAQVGNPDIVWVGRSGGPTGSQFADDLASGAWKSRRYEVRDSAPGGSATSWFPVGEFVALIDAAQSQ